MVAQASHARGAEGGDGTSDGGAVAEAALVLKRSRRWSARNPRQNGLSHFGIKMHPALSNKMLTNLGKFSAGIL